MPLIIILSGCGHREQGGEGEIMLNYHPYIKKLKSYQFFFIFYGFIMFNFINNFKW